MTRATRLKLSQRKLDLDVVGLACRYIIQILHFTVNVKESLVANWPNLPNLQSFREPFILEFYISLDEL